MSIFSQKGPGVPRGMESQAEDANPSDQSGFNARIVKPVWKQFVDNEAYQESSRGAVQAEKEMQRQAARPSRPASLLDDATEKWGGTAGRLFRKFGRQTEEVDPEQAVDHPVAGPFARKALWERELAKTKQEAADIDLSLQNPAFHARALAKKDREDMLAEGSVLPETDPRHAELKKRLIDADAYEAEKKDLSQKAWNAKVRARQLESTDPETWWQSRLQQAPPSAAEQRTAVVQSANAKEQEADAAEQSAIREAAEIRAKKAQGMTAAELEVANARLAEIGQAQAKANEVKQGASEQVAQVQQQAAAEIDNRNVFQETISAFKRGYAGGMQSANILQGATDPTNAQDIADYEKMKKDNPSSKDFQEFQNAKGFKDSAMAFIKNPIRIITEVMAESAAQMVPSIALGAAGGSIGGAVVAAPTAEAAAPVTVPSGAVIGSAIGAGTGSYLAEYGSAMMQAMQEAGMDATKPESIQQFFGDETKLATAKEFAIKRGIPVALFDAVSAGLAGKFMKPLQAALKSGEKIGVGQVLAATGKELATQAAAGPTGEALGQVVSEGKISDAKSIFLEGIAELGSAPFEVASNLREFGGKQAAPEESPTVVQNLEAIVNTALTAIDPQATPTSPEEMAQAALFSRPDDGPQEYAEGVLIERELAQVEQEDTDARASAEQAVLDATATGDQTAIKAAETFRDSLGAGRADTTRAVLKIAAGQQLDDLTAAELAGIGMEETKTGFKPMKDATVMVRTGADGSIVLTDAALKAVESVSPRARARVKLSEAEALQKAKQRASQPISTDTPNGGQGDPATGSTASAGGFPIETKGAVEFDVPMRDGTMLRVQAADADAALQEAAAIAPITGQPATPIQSAQPASPQNAPLSPPGTANGAPIDPGMPSVGPSDAASAPTPNLGKIGSNLEKAATPTGVTNPSPPPASKEKLPSDKDKSAAKALAQANSTFAKAKKKLGDRLTKGSDRAVTTPDRITIDPKQIVEQAIARGMNDEQAAEYFDRVLDEEVRHLAQYDAAKILFNSAGKPGGPENFDAWMQTHYAGIWQSDFVATGKADIIRDIYARTETGFAARWETMSDADKALEAIRMMSQGDAITEQGKLWVKISKTLEKALRAALASLKQFADIASPTLKTEISNLENALRNLTSDQSRPGSPKADPAKPAQGGSSAGTPRGGSRGGEAASSGKTQQGGGGEAGSPLEVGQRVEFKWQGRTLTGKVRLAKSGAVSIYPDENPNVSVGPVAAGDVRVLEVAAPDMKGEKINKDWTAFAPESGTLGIPRGLMPQISSGDRSALVQFLKARGVDYQSETVFAKSLKPTQTEYSPAKVAKAKAFTGGNRAILISADNHVLDGHHQWMAALENDERIPVIRLDAPIRKLLPMTLQMPSVSNSGDEILEAPKAIPAEGEKIDTIAGKMSFVEFERKGYTPDQVTKQDWVNLMRSERRRLGQQEEGERPNAPWQEYESFHEDTVRAAVKSGDKVDPEVLNDYPDLLDKTTDTKPAKKPASPATAGNGSDIQADSNSPIEMMTADEWAKAYLSPAQYTLMREGGTENREALLLPFYDATMAAIKAGRPVSRSAYDHASRYGVPSKMEKAFSAYRWNDGVMQKPETSAPAISDSAPEVKQGDITSVPYDDLVRASYAGQEARRKLADLRPIIERRAEQFRTTGQPRDNKSVVQWLASVGAVGNVGQEVKEILAAVKLLDAVDFEKEAIVELNRRSSAEKQAGTPSKPRKKSATSIPDTSKLSEGDKKALDVIQGLFAAELPDAAAETFTRAIPPDRFMKLMDAANTWFSEGVTTPEKLADKLEGLAPERKAVVFSQPFWFALKAVGAEGAAEPDWAGIYASRNQDAKDEGQPVRTDVGAGNAGVGVDEVAAEAAPAVDKESLTTETAPAVETPVEAAAEVKGEMVNPQNRRPAKEIKAEIIQRVEEEIAKLPKLETFEEDGIWYAQVSDQGKVRSFRMLLGRDRKYRLEEPLGTQQSRIIYSDSTTTPTKRIAIAKDTIDSWLGYKSSVVTFAIPGDGTFKIIRSRSNLDSLLARVKAMPITEKASKPSRGFITAEITSAMTKEAISRKDSIILGLQDADYRKKLAKKLGDDNLTTLEDMVLRRVGVTREEMAGEAAKPETAQTPEKAAQEAKRDAFKPGPEAQAILDDRPSPDEIAREEWRNAPLDPDAFGGANYPLAQPEAPAFEAETPAEKAPPVVKGEKAHSVAIDTLDSLMALTKRLREGEITADEVKAAWESYKENEIPIQKEVMKMTMKELEKFQGIRKPDNKADAVRMAMDYLEGRFNPGNMLSYGGVMGREDMNKAKRAAMDKAVSQWTDEIIQAQAQERRDAIAAREKALNNPETLDEWRQFVRRKGLTGMTAEEVKAFNAIRSPYDLEPKIMARGEKRLTPEQLAAYDEVRGIDRKAEAQARKEREATVRGVKADTDSEIVETKHTKTGVPLFVVRLADRVEREVYNSLNAAAKRLGGGYSSYSRDGAVPGFQFKNRTAAEQFQAITKGETVDRAEAIQERQAEKKSAAAEKLAALADRMDSAADKILAADRKTNTAKRAREAGYAESNANSMKAMATTMRNLAEAIESGEATHLDGVRAKTHVETLYRLSERAKTDAENAEGLTYSEREKRKGESPTPDQIAQAKYPYPFLNETAWKWLIENGKNTPGAMRLTTRLEKVFAAKPSAQANGSYITGAEMIGVVKELLGKITKQDYTRTNIESAFENYDRVQAMGLTDLPMLRAALREFLQYRGTKAKADPVKVMERELVGMKIPGFFPTPPAVIERMLVEAGDLTGKRVLEPSAGKGDLVDAAASAGAQVDAIEQQSRLREILSAKGANVIGQDFTDQEVSPDYDAVLMNPPFEDGQDAEHVRRAFDFLKPGGKLVAIMGEGVFGRSDRKSQAFRDWLDSVDGTSEKLPEGSFKSAFRPTGVNTRLVVIEKPQVIATAADSADLQKGTSSAKGITPPPVKKPGAIEDFGEKIIGARKDTWGKFKSAIGQELPDDAADITISKYFPEPDYETATANGVGSDALATYWAIRDSIPPKPRMSYKLRRWADMVRGIHPLMQKLASGSDLTTAEYEAMNKLFYRGGDLVEKINLYKDLGYPAFTKADDWKIIGGVSMLTENGVRLEKPVIVTAALFKGRFVSGMTSRAEGRKGYIEVLDMVRSRIAKEMESPTKKAAKPMEFSILSDRRTGDVFIGRKALNGWVRLKTGFPDVKQARQFLADNQAALEEQWEGLKKPVDYRKQVNEPREGPTRREGDVTPEQFQDAFGFRGVQFGNWVEGDRRQVDMNEAFDAFMDLAEALGIPPKAVSLDGSLGLAFGARGIPNAKAHYESGEVVINLTKKTGPGSLGHEWFHAFDNYFARLDRTGETKAQPLDKFATDSSPAPKNMRPEVWEAFKKIKAALSTGTFAERSKKLDEVKSKPYYSTTIEKAARAFERYTVDRLAGMEISNDFLVNLTKDESPALPTAKEMDEGIRQAYDELFNVLDAVPTDKGMSLRAAELPDAPPFYSQLQRTIEAKMPASATPAQVVQIATSGAKAEEVKWSGLIPWLQGREKVSKTDVLEWLANEGAVRFQEVTQSDQPEAIQWTKDGNTWTAKTGNLRATIEGMTNGKFRLETGSGTRNVFSTLEEAKSEVNDMAKRMGTSAVSRPTRYAQYVLPGGESYREVVLAMPHTTKPQFVIAYKDGSGQLGGMTFDTREQAEAEMGDMFPRRTDLEIQTFYREKPVSEYTSSHFPDVPNYVAHMRLNERTDAAGKPGLFIEELQSDRHQEGRKKGYIGDGDSKTVVRDIRGRFLGEYSTEEEARQRQPDGVYFDQGSGAGQVADAPYRTTWPLALFKRALRDAVARNKEWIGWTVGETQNDRFDLSAQLQTLSTFNNGKGGWDISGRAKGTNALKDIASNVSTDKLPDYIGKEMAERVVAAQPEKGWKEYSGVDLKVGGSGMKGFYDTILPKEIGKYVKQWGGKVEDAEINTRAGVVKQMPDGMWQVTRPDGDVSTFATKSDAEYFTKGKAGTPIHRITITPEMRKGVQAGQALFAADLPESAPEDLDMFKKRGRKAFETARPLIEEAERQMKAFGSGSMGVDPKFANFGGKNQDSRNQVDIVRAYDTFARETRADRDTFAKAKELLAKDPAGVEELAMSAFGKGRPAIADHEQLAIEMFIQKRLAETGDDRQAQIDNFVLIQANILNRREAARTLRIGFDKFMSPEERARQQIADAIFKLNPKVEARAKTMTLAERKGFLAEAGSSRIAEVEKELKKLGLRISQVIGKNRALQLENSRLMKETLKTRDLMDQKILRMVQKGASILEIRRLYGKDAAEKAQAITDAARAELSEKIRKMMAAGMSRDQIREAMKAQALNAAPLGGDANAMSPADIDAEIEAMLAEDFGLPSVVPERPLPSAKPKKAKAEKLASTNPLSSDWSRPEFTDGMKSYTFDTKDRAGIMERVEIIRNLAGAVGKISGLEGDKRAKAELKLREINAILAKYGTDAAEVFESGRGIESYGFDVTDIAHVAAVARAINAIDADVVDKASEYLYASMLSGLQTMLVNATAIVPAVWESTVGRGINLAINSMLKAVNLDSEMAEQVGESKYMLKALAPALSRAMSNFQASMAAQHPMFDRDVNAMEIDWDKILGGGSHRMVGSISGRKGDIIRLPMRLLTATDDFNRTLLACVEVGTFAYRIAKAKGMKPGSPEMDKFIRQEVNTPGSFSYQLASKKASGQIYSNPLPGQRDPHTGKTVPIRDLGDVVGYVAGKITDAVAKEHESIFLKGVAAAFRISFFPFQRTPFNILRKGIRHTLNPFSLFDIGLGIIQNARTTNPDGTTKWEWKITGDSQEAHDRRLHRAELIERMGQQLQGSVLMMLLMATAAGEGDDDDLDKPLVITGSLPFLPSNMAERDARMRSGIGAYRISFRRGDGSERFGFNYGRIEPVATTLSATIDTLKSVKRTFRAGGGFYDAAAAALGGFASQAQDKTFMRGVGDLIGLTKNIVAEPDIKENRKALQFLAGRLAMVIPNIIKQPVRELDPQFRERSNGFMEELLYQAAPFGQKPAKVDPYGQPLGKPGTMASRPLDVTDAGTDKVNPIDRMLIKWADSGAWSKAENPADRKAYFPSPITNAEFKNTKTGINVKMNSEQLNEFREKSGILLTMALKSQGLNYENPTQVDIEKVRNAVAKSREVAKKALAHKFSK